MDDRFLCGFPDIVEAIFENLGVKSLFASRLVCRAWQQLIDGQKCTWRKKLSYFEDETPDEYKKAFSDIIQQSSLEELKLLARSFETYSKDALKWWPHLLMNRGECKAFKTFFPHFTRWPFLFLGLNYLHWAAWSGVTDLIGFILQNTNITVNDTNMYGWTAAHLAAKNGWVEVLKTVCPLMDDRNPGDEDGCTPLHVASMEGHLDVFKVIASCQEDPDLNPKDASGKTPLDYASLRFFILIETSTLSNI